MIEGFAQFARGRGSGIAGALDHEGAARAERASFVLRHRPHRAEQGVFPRPAPLAALREAVTFIKRYSAGEEVEWRGVRFRSEWSRRELPVYIACGAPKACYLVGQVADGVIATSNADFTTNVWRMEQIARGAESVGRDPAEIDYWMRGLIYLCDDEAEAVREVAGYAVNGAYMLWIQMRQNNPESEALRRRIEKGAAGNRRRLQAGPRRIRPAVARASGRTGREAHHPAHPALTASRRYPGAGVRATPASRGGGDEDLRNRDLHHPRQARHDA